MRHLTHLRPFLKKQLGQAIIEWSILCVLTIGLWLSLFHWGHLLYNQTVLQTWSIIGARQALSNTKKHHYVPTQIALFRKTSQISGKATTRGIDSASHFTISLPRGGAANIKEEPLFSLTPFFGSLSSHSLDSSYGSK